jgi:hypothetical protein
MDEATKAKKIVKYGAVGEEGVEFMARSKKAVQAWIDEEVAGTGHSDRPMPADYYYIHGYTSAELKEVREV